MKKWESYMSGPKWAGISQALFDIAQKCSLTFRITHQDKGWIRETVFFEVEGTDDKILLFQQWLSNIITSQQNN